MWEGGAPEGAGHRQGRTGTICAGVSHSAGACPPHPAPPCPQLNSTLPYCAFNGGNDVFVDIGNKSLGLEALMAYLGFT